MQLGCGEELERSNGVRGEASREALLNVQKYPVGGLDEA